ncbi:teichoic acids export ABC transporter ATP-binding subunit TagH [Clostridium baratii]|uniref:teichoic acids export ABC transporter ATP-binding subunit TagH n=1 Tax=Clostridium baratii TaxID=1561 RepID=UPI0029073BB0|nr:teichoic acids export ABC transporter ATP-binding subunit TagH [Clostridium baratii]MDU4912109.1 teichoic acids export ABC transporter ATP-binding subunit TagH [Clostridium baratii]
MKDNKYSVRARNISKTYKMYSGAKEKILDLILPKGAGKNFNALKDLTFEIEKGKCVGLIGLNGAGKSTLSNILAGVSLPTKGEIYIEGNPAIIAIGSGMNNFLTGMENVETKALMMGFKKDKIEEIKRNVIEFAEIGDFINQPIRTYSSGMRSRLGFAISIHMDPDILVIDEALSVGDQTFTKKCLDKMNEFKEKGKTIFFVSHSIGQVKEFCDEVLWLEYGMLKEYGNASEVIPRYQEYLNSINKMTKEEKEEYKKEVLKEQEHSLLNNFKLVDQKFKKIKLRGKIFKYTLLINKQGKRLRVPYNFDYSTFIFGGIVSIIRKQNIKGILLLLGEIVAIFISSGLWGILTRMILTFGAALFTGKSYVDNLIENRGYIPYELYKENKNNELKELIVKESYVNDSKYTDIKSENNYVIQNLKEQNSYNKKNRSLKNNNLIFITLIVLMLITACGAVIYKNDFNMKGILSWNENSKGKINEKFLITIEDKGKINEFAFLNINEESNKIELEYYKNDFRVKEKGKSIPLDTFIKSKKEKPDMVILSLFKKEGFKSVNISKDLLIRLDIKNNSTEDKYRKILTNIVDDKYKKEYEEVFKEKDEKWLDNYKEFIELLRKENDNDKFITVKKGEYKNISVK